MAGGRKDTGYWIDVFVIMTDVWARAMPPAFTSYATNLVSQVNHSGAFDAPNHCSAERA